MHITGPHARGWSFSSTGFEPGLCFVVAVGAMVGATVGTDLALDPLVPGLPMLSAPEPIVRKAAPRWTAWWEAAMTEYRHACRHRDVHRSMKTCEALAGPELSLLLNRVREPVTGWVRELDVSEVWSHSSQPLVDAAELAHQRRARDFTVRCDFLPVTGPVVVVVSEEPARAAAQLLISSREARRTGRMDQILGECLERVAF